MKKKYIYAFAALFTLGVTGCELGDFGDTNVNPNATTEANPGALLTNAAAGLGGYASMTRPGLYAQYFSQTQYTDESLYSVPQLDFVGNYSGPLNNLQTVINLNTSNNMNQVAKIMQQYIFWTITDRWGDVPYSEALQALENPNPVYDPQERIYRGMIDTLAAAVAAFDNSSPIEGDIVFGGNVDAWKRTANSLRMLMAIRLSERFPEAGGYAATQFNAALNDPAGYISSNAQNFTLNYPGGNFMNPWFSLYNGRRDYAESATMTSLMASLGDNRQRAFGGANDLQGQSNSNETSNVGVPYGLARANAEAFTSTNTEWARVLRGDFRKDNSELVIIGASHVALARAEAAALGWTSEDVSAVYREGIRLSHERWGVSVPENYFSQNNVALASDGTEEDLRKIAIQRYIAFYPDGLQGWSVWRKTGYPELTPAPAASGRAIPLRYTYTSNERSTNAAAVEEAEARLQPQGGDVPTARVWWDVD